MAQAKHIPWPKGPALSVNATVSRVTEYVNRAEDLLRSVPDEHLLAVAQAVIQLDGHFVEERLRDVNNRRKAIGEIALSVDPGALLPEEIKEELMASLRGRRLS